MDLDFWIDPICPWCWQTSRWVVDIATQRNLTIRWRPISLLIKNQMAEDSPWYPKANRTLGLLRVMEAIREAEGETKLGDLYTAFGRRIHHDENVMFDPTEALAEAGLEPSYATRLDDSTLDGKVRAHMDDAFALVGTDVGTPILGFANSSGKQVGFFGPVISRLPQGDDALKLWDGIMLTAGIEGFWELKRTRTEHPTFGPRP